MQGEVFKTSTNNMEKVNFILNLKKLGGVESVSGICYCIDSVCDKYVIGTRLSTLREFKIETDGLFSAYNDVLSGKIFHDNCAAWLCQPYSVTGSCYNNGTL